MAEEDAVATPGTVDPRDLPAWSGVKEPPSLDASEAAKRAFGKGPATEIFEQCLPARALANLALGTSMKDLTPQAQWLICLTHILRAAALDPRRRRFTLQDPKALDLMVLDFEDPIKQCPPDQAAVPHGPDGRAAILRESIPDLTDAELAGLLAKDTTSGITEATEQATRDNAPLINVRYLHIVGLKKDPAGSAELLNLAADAAADGFLPQAAMDAEAASEKAVAEAEAQQEAGQAEGGAAASASASASAAEAFPPFRMIVPLDAALEALQANAALLAPAYLDHFKEGGGGAKGTFQPSFIVPPSKVRGDPGEAYRPTCANPACGKKEPPAELRTKEKVAAAFALCAACKCVHYCGRECQKAHWPNHKEDCAKGKVALEKFQEQAKAARAALAGANPKKSNKKKGGRGKREKAS